MIGFPVGMLQFSLLSRSSRRSVLRTAQAIQQCGSTESNWLRPDRESREFNDKLNLWNTAHWQGMKEQRYYVLQTLNELWLSRQRYHCLSWIFVHIDYTRTRSLKLCFVLPNKIRISPLFVRLSSVCLILALSMWAWNSRGRAAFKDNLQASFLAVCCSTMSCNSGCKSVASRGSFI